MAHCVCECGKEYDGQVTNIRNGKVKSCGCLAKELREMHVVNADAVSKSPLYHVWNNMKQRCNNPNVDSYPNYGGRGITVCKEWSDDFKVFETWAIENGYRPNRGLSIDRIDVNGNYCPENCRWTNVFVQSVNRRPPKPPKAIKGGFTINGITKTKKAWCEEYGVWTATVNYRMKKMGMTFEEALTAEKKSEGNHLAALNLPEPKVKQLDNLNRTNSHIEANLYMAFIRKNFSDRVVSQHTIGKYRVDFWIEGTDIVVECDGLEFHKGKDQLKSDYERERYLVIHGFRVLRYTGSEINQDPDAVADEIIGFAEGGLQWQDQQMTKKTISSECESIAT
jgi:very-short-patch-repair endonuclease